MGAPPPTALLIFGINPRRVGGIECHTRELVRRLGERGWRAVLCFHQAPCPEVRDYLSLPNVVWDEYPNGWNTSVETSRHLLRLLRLYRPRLLHLQFTPLLGPNPWLARLAGVRTVVFTDHHSHAEGFQPARMPSWKLAIGRLVSAPYSLVVTVSEFNRHVLATLGNPDPSRVRLVYNGADLSRRDDPSSTSALDFRARYGLPAERILITQVALVNRQKGVPDLLQAAKLTLAGNPDLHFAFVGDGKETDEFIRQSAALGLAGNVTFTGLVKYPMAEGVYAATDIYCQASRWQEAFGLAIAEAMSFGKPVVATRIGGIPEVVADGVTGYLVPPGEPARLAEYFLLLARDAALRNRLGAAGLARAREKFDVRVNVGTLLDLYDECAGKA